MPTGIAAGPTLRQYTRARRVELAGYSMENGDVSQTTLSRRPVIFSLMKLLILAAVVWWVWQTLQSGFKQLERHRWHLEFHWLIAAGGLYLLGLLPAGLYWHRLLAALDQRPPLAATLRAYYIGHLGKYVPGKALVPILRSGLLAERGAGAGPAVVSVFVETLTMMAVGAAVAVAIGALLLQDRPGVVFGGVLLMLAAGVPTLPPVMNWIFRRRWAARLFMPQESGRCQPADAEDGPADTRAPAAPNAPRLSWRLVLSGWLLNIVGWIILGLSLWAVLRSLIPAEQATLAMLPYDTAAVALAMVAGFLSGLPGGIGVRDGILIGVLSEKTPEEIALVAAILLRIVWLVSELIISGILYIGGRGSRTEAVGSGQ